MSVNNRIKEFCDYNKIKQTDLVALGLGSKQTINAVFNSRQAATNKFISNLLKAFPNLDAYYLMTGEKKSEYELNEPQAIYGKTNNKLLNYIDRLEKDIKRIEMECEELKKQVVKPGT